MIVLQKFGFKESKYERPQDSWVCGRLAEGKPCELGPGLNGRCRVTTVCQPRLENDRWQCRRPASAGGPCEAGPLPDGQCCMTLERCVPRPSLRTRRKRSVVAALALVVGVLAVTVGGKGGRYFMMPNKLSAPHAGLTDCSTCHAGARTGEVDLLHRLFTAVEPRQNSSLCLNCHDMGATNNLAPHTHPVEDLKRLTEKLRSDSRSWPAPSLMQLIEFPSTAGSPGAETEIQCATCHKEHRGVFADLRAVSNQRCQTCHVSRFGSFADSHPQFVKFPYQRRPRLAFDHQSHEKYFRDAQKAAGGGQGALDECGNCHQLGVRKRYEVVKSFASMCASCHTGDITGATQVSGPKGIGVIAVPGLDVKTLRERGIDIGYWPLRSEAILTPFMTLLLGSSGANVISSVAGLDLLDLRKADDRDLARVATLAWAIKRLFNQLETTNPAARTLAGDNPGMQVAALQMAALTGSMSHDVIASANQEWFACKLQDDLQRHDRGEPTKPPSEEDHCAANPEAASVESKAIAPTKAPEAASTERMPPPGGKAARNNDEILGPNKRDEAQPHSQKDALAPSKTDEILTPAPSKADDNLTPVPRGDDILSGDKPSAGNALSQIGDGSPAPAPSKDDILSGDKPSAGNVLSQIGDDNGAPKEKQTSQSAEAKPSPDTSSAQFDPEAWAQTGGWYREDFTIRYHPSAHADQFLQTWLDFTGRAYGSSLHDELAPIFDNLAAKDAVSRCTKCHSVDDVAGAKIVNWRPFDANTINNRFTNYSHKPHVELIAGTKTCLKCHEFQQTDDFRKTYEGGDPVNYTPNFKYIDKALCSACHSQQTEWQNCTLCHGYHVPDVTSASPAAALPVAFDKSAIPSIAAALPSLDPESEARLAYARAEKAGTEEAWGDFIANHPTGHYHDLAVQGIAKLSRAAPEKPAITPDKSAVVVPSNPTQAATDKLAALTPDKPESAATPTNAAGPPLDKSATITPEDSSSTTPAKPATAHSGEPTDANGFFSRGLQRASDGDLARALQDFDEVIRRDPEHAAPALNNRCWIMAIFDEMREALKACDESLRLLPNYADALDSRGLVNLKLGYYKRAIADYNAALSQFSGLKRASALYGRGIAKRRSGDAAGAKGDIDIAKVYNPSIAGEFAKYGIQ